jgi:hypothetical protein
LFKALKLPFLTSLVLALLATLSFQINVSFAAVYKSGYATFSTYYQTKNFHLSSGTYKYKGTSYHSKNSPKSCEQYLLYLYKGSKRIKEIGRIWSCKKSSTVSKKFKVSSGNYSLKFMKITTFNGSKNYNIYVTKYTISK